MLLQTCQMLKIQKPDVRACKVSRRSQAAPDPYVNICIRVVMQSFELCKAMVTQSSVRQGFVALEGLRASHN